MPYKVLVVEDEPPILNNIVRKLSALNLPVTVTATAMDGEEALVQIKEHRPQIVFTDIRMAGMDGLTLCAKISKEYPGVKTVVISGYSEFEYAQKAIKCKVAGYLLKPVNTDELYRLVESLCDALRQEGETLQRRLLARQLSGAAQEDELPIDPAQTYGLYLLCIGNLLEHATGGVDLSYCGALWRHADLAGILDTLLPAGAQWCLVEEKNPNEQMLVTSAFCPNVGARLHQEMAARLAGSTSVTVCACPGAVGYQELWKSAQLLRHTLRHTLIPCVSNFVCPDSTPRFVEGPTDALYQMVQRAVESRQKAPFSAALGRYLTALEENGAPQRYLEQGMAGIIKALGEHSGTPTPPGLRDEVYRLVEESQNAGAFYTALQKKLEMLFADSFPVCVSGEELARTAKKYLEENYQKNITIQDLTDTFHFSASYIGRVFRDQYGVPPVKYLLQLRMEQAKKLLREGVSVVLAAQAVGYEDAHYFSRIFRATVGKSPSEYRRGAQTLF